MNSACLYDQGEESWPIKLHIGCGGIRLLGYTNIDAQGRLASDSQDAARENETTVTDYYSRLDGSPANLPTRRPNIIDMYADVAAMPYQACTVDKIVGIQVFEHLTPAHATMALAHWHCILRYHAPLILSVPDMYETLDMIDTEPEFARRHMLGRQKGDYLNTHHAWYTLSTLTELLIFSGFSIVMSLPNFHFYPAIVVRACK